MENCISWNLFLKYIIEIKEKSDQICDGWNISGNSNIEGGAYLMKKSQFKVKNDQSQQYGNTLKKLEENDMFNKSADVIYVMPGQLLNCEFHVTYSFSYNVPVLSFIAWKSDGGQLSLEEAWEAVHPSYSQQDMYSVLTQMDHAVLLRPFLTLHPCKTSEIITNFLNKSNNPIISWLSTVGPAIQLHLSLEYEKV